MAKFFRFLGYHYERCFRWSPMVTLALANGVCSICGDGAAQLIPIFTSKDPADQQRTFDFARLFRYFVFGLNMGPIGGKWNEVLDRHIQPRLKAMEDGDRLPVEKDVEMSLMGAGVGIDDSAPNLSPLSTSKQHRSSALLPFRAIFKMVLADQLIMAPFNLILFLSFMSITEGATMTELQDRIHRLFWTLLLANWQVWPIIQMINFRFMPLRLRVPFSAGCGIIWTIFLSYASSP